MTESHTLQLVDLSSCSNIKHRWIGFDMDDCVGHVIPVAQIVKVYDPAVVASMLLPYETSGKTWLLRPGMTQVIAAVAEAYKARKITGAFLYSNNKRSTTVEFTRTLMNLIARNVCGVEPFMTGFYRHDVSRDSTTDKHFTDICNLLHCVDLPIPSSQDDLLYFDDRFHVLATEIAHYHRVPQYNTWTPVEYILAALEPLFGRDDTFTKIVDRSHANQDYLIDDDSLVWACPPVDTDAIVVFMSGIDAFLAPPPPYD